MANIKNNSSAQDTKRRLIESAGEVFAEHGFERATIKDITDRADASIAAVNYHFGDKQELYYQAVSHAHQAGINAIRRLIETQGTQPASERLHEFIHSFLKHTLDPERPAWEMALITREMREPTAACDRLVGDLVEPFVDAFGRLIAEIAGDPPPPPRVSRLLVDSVMGQCLYYVHNQCKFARYYPDDPPLSERVDEIADHITRFTLAAISCLKPFK